MLPTRDYAIMELVNIITDKSDWQRKVFDEAIVAKWRAEILDSNPPEGTPRSTPPTVPAAKLTRVDTGNGTSNTSGSELNGSPWSARNATMDVSPRMFDWVIAEVKYKTEVFTQLNCIEALDGVWKSDTCVSEGLRKALEKAVRPLEDIPEVGFLFSFFNFSFQFSCARTTRKSPQTTQDTGNTETYVLDS